MAHRLGVQSVLEQACFAFVFIPMSISDPVIAPTLANSEIPHRKLIRAWLEPLARQSTPRALALIVLDVILFAGCLVATVVAPAAWMQLVASVATGLVIGRLFILGHDACHQSLTSHRTLNRWLGRLVFLPSLTPYSLWEVGHNVIHHGYTNLRGFDFVWQPRSLEEYRALPFGKRVLERVYRSGWAPWLYYMVEIWWSRLLFPNREKMPTRRAVFTLDGLLVCAFAAAWIVGLVLAAHATGQSVAWLVGVGFALPFVLWNGLIGFVVYVHHTHLGVAWYEDKRSWAAAQPFVSTTVHLTFKSMMGSVLHHIMEHTAHHVDMSVPLYRLKAAQALLEQRLAGHIVVQPFSWRWYANTARRCKLYDFKAGCWTDFSGHSVTAAHPATS